MKTCILTVGTVTSALRAKRLLAAVGIAARTVKTTDEGQSGCAYGLELAATDLPHATHALDGAGMHYSWSARGGR